MGTELLLAGAVLAGTAIGTGTSLLSRPKLPSIPTPRQPPSPPPIRDLPPPPTETDIGAEGSTTRDRRAQRYGVSQTLLVRPGLGDPGGLLRRPGSGTFGG